MFKVITQNRINHSENRPIRNYYKSHVHLLRLNRQFKRSTSITKNIFLLVWRNCEFFQEFATAPLNPETLNSGSSTVYDVNPNEFIIH